MAKHKRVYTFLVCEESGQRNYSIKVGKGRTPGSLRMKKYCPKLRRHTWHKESK